MTLREAYKIIEESTPIEIVMSYEKGTNFYQFVGIAGGDILTYRVYHSGAVTQR